MSVSTGGRKKKLPKNRGRPGGSAANNKNAQPPSFHIAGLTPQCSKSLSAVDSGSGLTVGEILAAPLEATPTPMEKKTAENIIKRIIHQDSTAVLKLSTGGQVSNTLHNTIT